MSHKRAYSLMLIYCFYSAYKTWTGEMKLKITINFKSCYDIIRMSYSRDIDLYAKLTLQINNVANCTNKNKIRLSQ